MPVPMTCLKCQADLRGKPIPPEDRASYGGETYFSRVIAHYSSEADTVVAWRCPDCAHAWPRKEPLPRGYRIFDVVG